jgi:DNA-binding IclR family transcriptional regulator
LGELARSGRPSKDLITIVRPFLEKISNQTRETAFLAVPSGDQIVFIDKVEPMQAIRYSAQIGTRRPLYCTAHGKIALASRSETDLERYIAMTRFEARTDKTIVDPAALRKELAKVRRQGFSISDGEFTQEAYGISVGLVAGSHGELIGMISAVGPTSRMRPQRREFASLLTELARQISVQCAELATVQA